jgi:hypothetical protein
MLDISLFQILKLLKLLKMEQGKEINNQLVFSSIPREELKQLFEKSIEDKVSAAIEELLPKLTEHSFFDQILTFDELCQKFKREPPTVKKAIVALGITPHSWEPKANPLYLYSDVIKALRNAPGPIWYNSGRKKYLLNIDLDHEI